MLIDENVLAPCLIEAERMLTLPAKGPYLVVVCGRKVQRDPGLQGLGHRFIYYTHKSLDQRVNDPMPTVNFRPFSPDMLICHMGL